MEKLSSFDFQEIQIDLHGNIQSGVDELVQHVNEQGVTDVILMCHGFRNDESDARRLYGDFLQTFIQNQRTPTVSGQLSSRKFDVGGIFWPSMIFTEPHNSQGTALAISDDESSQQRLSQMKAGLDEDGQSQIDKMISLIPQADVDGDAQMQVSNALIRIVAGLPVEADNECRAAFANATPESLINAFSSDPLDTVAVGAVAGGAMGIPGLDDETLSVGQAQSFLGTIAGFVPKFLNLTTFLLMFHRCGDVGANGISQIVRRLKTKPKAVRVHLVGHSLGGRAVTACVKQLTVDPAITVDSMLLLEAAYSHFGLSKEGTTAGGVNHPRGFFRDVIEKQAVKGPILATHSDKDSVVGFAYTSMAAVSLNNSRAFGDESSPFGGIGRNGVLDVPEAVNEDLMLPGQAYVFSPTKIHNLNGSRLVDGKPLIGSHGDVTNPAVTWAFASLVATT